MDKTYHIGSKNGLPCITCLVCEKTSFSRGDIEHLYCAYCAEFHQDRVLRRSLVTTPPIVEPHE